MNDLLRSWLYVRPEQRYLQKETQADCVIYELEDAVRPWDKDEARRKLDEFLSSYTPRGQKLFVRTNPVDNEHYEKDISLVLKHQEKLRGVVLPKVWVKEHIKTAYKDLEHSKLTISPIIETAYGLLNSQEILFEAAYTGVLESVHVGTSGDWSSQFNNRLGLQAFNSLNIETNYYLSKIIVEALAIEELRGTKIPVIAGVYLQSMGSSHELIQECSYEFSQGFSGKAAIHPSHIEAINQQFSPKYEQYERAQEVVTLYKIGKIKDGRKRIVAEPQYKQAKKFLKEWERFFKDGLE